MPLYDTEDLTIELSGTSDTLPDPRFTGDRTHQLINRSGAGAIVTAALGGDPLPFLDLALASQPEIIVPARSSMIVQTNGTQWQVRRDSDEWLAQKNNFVPLAPQTDQFAVLDIVDDGSPSGVWPNRVEVWYTGPGGSPARHRVQWFNEFGEHRVTAAKNSTVPSRIYLQDPAGPLTHTANAFEIVDNPTDRVEIFTVDSDGRASGYIEPYVMSVAGVLTVQTGKSRIYLEGDYVVETVRAAVGTAPTGAPIIVDVNIGGASIYNVTPANRPTIPIGDNEAHGGTPDNSFFFAGDRMTVDVDQIGSTIAGSDLTVTVRLRKLAVQV